MKEIEVKDRPSEVVMYACDSGHTLVLKGGMLSLQAYANYHGWVLHEDDLTLRCPNSGAIMWRAAVFS